MEGSLTTAAQVYINVLGSYLHQFLQWGQWLFFGLLTINIVIMCLWYAFDRDSFAESVGQFIRKFFMIALFYTIMLNHQWLLALLQTSETIGATLTGSASDPSSLINQGVGISNQVLQPVMSTSLLTVGFGAIVILIVYVVILFCFMSIALNLAVTLITTTALIVLSTFFLGFAALSATTQIARNTLDVILANCVKLLGIYLVIAAGSKTISLVTGTIPTTVQKLDSYTWLLCTVILFWLLAKNLPDQLAKIVSNSFQESHGHSMAALTMSAVQYASVATKAAQMAGATVKGVGGAAAKTMGSAAYNAASHFSEARNQGMGLAGSAMKSATGMAKDALKSGKDTLSQHFSDLRSKMSGGEGMGNSSNIAGFSERLHQKAKQRFSSMKSNTQPSSAGRESAGSRNFRSKN